jgi:hypothetical protein
MKWLRYSGCIVTFRLNPFHWNLTPKAVKENDELMGPNEWRGCFMFLFLTIRVWIDDGQW